MFARRSSSHNGIAGAGLLTFAALGWLPFIVAEAVNSSTVDFSSFSPIYTTSVSAENCISGLRHFDPLTQKQTYYVGVHAPGGIETAVLQYNLTFQDYLTATAGKRFSPPIEFKMKPTTTPLYSWVDLQDQSGVDFYFSDTGVYSCVGVEMGADPVATTLSQFTVRGHEYELDIFSGAILTLADRDDINALSDLKGKVIGALEIGDFAGAQVQFYTMRHEGMDYIMDPKQVIFTGNQEAIVKGLLEGRWDVGFVRTGMVEMMKDENGDPLDAKNFKVLNPKVYVMNDGSLFPFLHSTPVFPEWPVYAGTSVAWEVIEEVQDALQALGEHKIVGKKMHDCIVASSLETCDGISVKEFYPDARCDTTKDIASLAYSAGIAGFHDGFRRPRSYFSLRTMQEAGGFLREDEKGNWHCTRAQTLYGAITCPDGHYKISQGDFEHACDKSGVPCPAGLSCYCQPCIKAFEVDLYALGEDKQKNFSHHDAGCDKMSLCASVQQTKNITFSAFDNKERKNANAHAVMHIGQKTIHIDVSRINGTYAYQFNFSYPQIGIGILEFYVNGEQIPQSPIRVEIVPRICNIDFAGQGKVPDKNGHCACPSNSVDIRGKCVSSKIFYVVVSVFLLLVATGIGLWYLNYSRKQADQLWLVNVEELHFDDPVEVIGQGSFGVVLLAEYRGTKVAIKRILNRERKAGTGSRAGSRDGSMLASAVKETDSVERSDEINRYAQSRDGSVDIESQAKDTNSIEAKEKDSFGESMGSRSGLDSRASGSGINMDFLVQLSIDRPRSMLAKWIPWFFQDYGEQARFKSSILGSASGGSVSQSTVASVLCPWFDKQTRRKNEFMQEMRLLSRLRHPCITTVMGAVIGHGHDPMLVMEYMEYGSLHDLLRNETMYAGGEVILQIMRDIAQGIRYLHSSKPPILHGDLKAKNILIDSRFRAKVGDFGLSTKKKNGLSGTPYFLAPEYLRGRTEYNESCDIYSLGIILWEIYSRKDPYERQNPRKILRSICDPRKNMRPPVPDTCPPRMVDIMKKCWSPDQFFRPQAKDLDQLFMDMSMQDAEPLNRAELAFKTRTEKPTGDMLYEVFPKHIADALKAGQKVEPEDHENVTVFFSEIIHFNDISDAMHPVKVCNMLDRLYIAFDKLAGKHGIFKVETIGDAYMGVTNLDGTHDHDYVKQVAKFAIDAVEEAGKILIDEDDPKKGYVRIRAGFHSGPVVSNVIGSLNPRYGLFGDTVNTASRMESNSYSQKILCSSHSAKILKEQAPEIPLTKRGKIAVKGKGDMSVYWVGDPTSKIGSSADKEVDDSTPQVNFAPDVE